MFLSALSSFYWMSKKGIVIQEDVLNRLRKLQEELTRKQENLFL